MRILRSTMLFALLAGIAAAATSMPAGNRAVAAMICPQFLAEYCVVEKDGFRHTDWTNPCFAAERGARVLHMGACEGPICPNVWIPVCSINPVTHRTHTYANQCWSDVADATLIHKGACPRLRHHGK
jgi:hypothetical protein